LATCLSRLRSDEIVTPRRRTCSLTGTVSSPSRKIDPQPPKSDRLFCAGPEQLCLIGIELQAVSRHPVADIGDAVFESCSG